MAGVQSYPSMEFLKPRRDTVIAYSIVYTSLYGSMQQMTYSYECGPKDFMTFIFCGRNHEALGRINSQLSLKGLSLELSDSNVLCRVNAPVERLEASDLKQLVFEIQHCILKLQENLEFEEISFPVEEYVLNKLFKSSAQQKNLLQMQLFEAQDQNSLARKLYLGLLYDAACKAEIEMCLPKVSVTKSIPVDTGRAQILIDLGLLQAAKEHINRDIHIRLDISGLQVSAPKHTIDSIVEFIFNFDRSILSKRIRPVEQKNMLLLPKVIEELQNAVAPHNVLLKIDASLNELFVFATTQIGVTNAVKVINEKLKECKVPITTEIRDMLEHEQFKSFFDSCKKHGEKNDFIIELTKENLYIAGLKNSVEQVEQFISDCLVKHSGGGDVEMLDDDRNAAVGDEESTETIQLTTMEDVMYIDKFYKKSSDVFVKHYETGFLLTGQAYKVQNATKDIRDMVKNVCRETFKFEDNHYFSGESGLRFLKDEVEDNCQVLCELKTEVTRPYHRNAVGKSKNADSDWEIDSERKLAKRKVNKGFEVILIATNIDDKEPEVVINIGDKKKEKGGSPLYLWRRDKKQVKIRLSLPFYHPSKELDDVNHAFINIFERMGTEGFTYLWISIDDTATWPLSCFVTRLLRAFIAYADKQVKKSPVHNLSILLCSSDENNIEKAMPICSKLLDECEDQISNVQGPADFVSVQIVSGSLNEMKADALVNTTHPTFNLSKGSVSKSLLQVAGKEMQKEIDGQLRRNITAGEIVVTRGYKLKCQYVFHGVLLDHAVSSVDSTAFYKESVQVLVTNCLCKAEELGCKSVAFPAIGTGRLQYPPDIVASSMFLAVMEYRNKRPETTLKEVLFVVYPADTEALQAFKTEEEKMVTVGSLAQNCNSSVVTMELVGPEENIDKAKQMIEDRLDLLKEKGLKTVAEIHGVSDVSYKLLLFFHSDVIDRYKEKGCQFDCEEDVLTIQADDKDSKMVATEVKQCIGFLKELCEEEIVVGAADLDNVVTVINDQYKDIVCCVADRKNEKILLYGKVLEDVKKGKILVTARSKKTLEDRSLSKSVGQIANADHAKSLKCTGRDQLDARSTVKSIGRPKPGMDKVKIEFIPDDLFRVMTKRHAKFFQNVNVTYDSTLEQAFIEKKHKDDFEKCLNEVRKLQTEVISLPKTMKTFELSDTSDQVVCIHNSANSTISVFGRDMKSVQDKVHQIKVELGLVEENRRGNRQLTESLQLSDPSDSDEEKSQRAAYQQKGARPKGHSAQGQPETYSSLNGQIFYTNEHIPIRVYTKNILHLEVDCIVNAANENLQHGGGIAEVISKAAGYELNKDCSNFIKTNGKLQTGEVYVSKPGKLDYKCVIHAVGPRWGDYKPHRQDDITKCKTHLFVAVLNSFLQAEQRGMKTIAVPAVSSAVFKVPVEICTEMYAAAVLVYSKQASSNSRLREIHFIDKKPDVIRCIQETFRKMIPNGHVPEFLQQKRSISRKQVYAANKDTSKSIQKTGQHESKPADGRQFPYCKEVAFDDGFKSDFHCHFSNSLLLIVSTGSIFDKQKVDCVVCSENIDGCGPGYTSNKLLETGKRRYKNAKEAAFRKTLKYGDVVVCKGEETGFKKVFHTVMWPKNPKDSDKEREDKFRKMFLNILLTAVTERCQSIVMPLLFTGHGKLDSFFCAERFLEACMEFSKKESSKHNKLIVFMINSEPKKTETIGKTIQNFVVLQKVMSSSLRDRPKPARPPSPKPVKKGPLHSNKQPRGKEPGTSDWKRIAEAGKIQNSNRLDVNKLSSTVRQLSVDDKESKSTFYDDEEAIEESKEMEADYDDDDEDDKYDDVYDAENGDIDNKREESQDENCVICMDTVSQPKTLKCGHIFCTDCIDSYFTSYKKVCPTCGVVCGVIRGDQPSGRMDVQMDNRLHCAGYEGAGCIVITYSFNSGTQGPDHPDPGKPYKGITRTAYLPNTAEGRGVLKMLEVAFDRKLVFTIGSSRTTGHEGVITWNDIHHKTNPKPNTPFGYPDPGYLDRVKDELAVKGVTPEDIPPFKQTGRTK